jgi:DNA-binding transcriptional regulator YiaG
MESATLLFGELVKLVNSVPDFRTSGTHIFYIQLKKLSLNQASRLTPERIRILRKKKGISQRDLAILIGVTTGTVVSWEKGKFKTKVDKKAALVALRKLRKQKVRKMLEVRANKTKDQKLQEGRKDQNG